VASAYLSPGADIKNRDRSADVIVMTALPELSRLGRKLHEDRRGLGANEQVLAAIKFNNAVVVGGLITTAAWAIEAAATALERAAHGPSLASRVGRYRDGVLVLTNQRLLFYTRRSLHKPGTFAYKPATAFASTEVRSIAKGKGRIGSPVEIVFADGSQYELAADNGRAQRHLLDVVDALQQTNAS
jgi:hypothetical protein